MTEGFKTRASDNVAVFFSFDPVAKDLQLFIQVNNLFDNLYASYGIGKEFFPAAERNYLFGIKLGL